MLAQHVCMGFQIRFHNMHMTTEHPSQISLHLALSVHDNFDDSLKVGEGNLDETHNNIIQSVLISKYSR